MAFNYLPGIIGEKLDGNLTIVPVNDNPVVMVIGQASQGDSETVFTVTRITDAARVFGKSGTLARGLYEASVGGALNLRLFRIGATPALLAGVGDGQGAGGITIETISKDDSAGLDYELFYDDNPGADQGRLRIYRASDDELVFDNNPSDPLSRVDLGEVLVTGSAAGVNTSITLTDTWDLASDTTFTSTNSLGALTTEVDPILTGGGRVFVTLGGETVEIASVTDDDNAVLVAASSQTTTGLTAVLEAFSDENTIGALAAAGHVPLAYAATNDPDGPLGVLPAGTAPVDLPVYTAGTDGLNLSRMKLYEALHDAYALLEDQEIDIVLPMDVYLDDLNVMDVAAADDLITLRVAAGNAYPIAGDVDDGLGKLYVEEYLGVNYYWWWFPSDPAADSDATFTLDGGADIFPAGVGSASATLGAGGGTLSGSDFHEVNFAYQLANFCYTQSRDNTEMTGVIGTLPPATFALRDVSQWIGSLPSTEQDANGNTVIEAGGNGTGLLGNKFMCGRLTAGGVPGHTVDGIDGLFNGGFIATDSGWLDDLQLKDDNDHLIDIGKYISITPAFPVLSNPSRNTSYTATFAATYGGFYSTLPVVSAPTNKLVRTVRLPFRVNTAKLDLLAGQRYVMLHAKTRGIVISDAPTAARPDSDYQRLSTVRQVKSAVDAVRRVGEPFLGEGMTGARLAALDTAIDSALKSLVKQGLLVRYEFQVVSSPQQRVLGQATVELKLVPAFELRQITVVVALAAV